MPRWMIPWLVVLLAAIAFLALDQSRHFGFGLRTYWPVGVVLYVVVRLLVEMNPKPFAPRGYTVAELLLGVAVCASGMGQIYPMVEKRNVAKGLEVRANCQIIQTALERYAVDQRQYPPVLFGGDREGWDAWHYSNDEAHPRAGIPQNAWQHDPLLESGYLDSYPTNPFVGNGSAVIQQTGPTSPSPPGYVPGMGDPRFGFRGNLMGNGLDDPKYADRWGGAHPTIQTERLLQGSVGGDGYPSQKGFPEGGIHYRMGGLRTWTNDGNEFLVKTHWPGNFCYRSVQAIPQDVSRHGSFLHQGVSPRDLMNPGSYLDAPPMAYLLGGYGSFQTDGDDLLRLASQSTSGELVSYREQGVLAFDQGRPCGFWRGPEWPDKGTGLPEAFGGGSANEGPLYFYGLDPAGSDLIIGAPDGCPDGIICLFTGILPAPEGSVWG